MAAHVAAGAGRGARRRREADGRARRRAEVPAGRGDRPAADDRRHDAVRRRDGGVPVLRRRGGQVHLEGHPRRHLRPDPGGARADRRRRRRHRVERAVLPGRQQARPCPGGRLHRGAQARLRDPALGVRDGRDVRRGGPARGCAVDRARRPGDRPRADRQPRDRQVHLHGQLGRRQGGRQDRGREAQGMHAGARRQVRGDHPRRRRPGLHAADAGVLRADELRSGLRRPDACSCPEVALRRGRGETVRAPSRRCRSGCPTIRER